MNGDLVLLVVNAVLILFTHALLMTTPDNGTLWLFAAACFGMGLTIGGLIQEGYQNLKRMKK